MRRVFLSVIAAFLIVALPGGAARAAVSATVDRSSIALDESLTLTITQDGGLFSSLDLAGLEKDFSVLRQNRSSSTRIVNGQASVATTVRIVLAPRRAGSLTIPPLSLGGEKTPSLEVKVVENAAPDVGGAGQPLFVETAVEKSSVVVQAQVLFTLRIFATTGAEVLDPGAPLVDNAVVEPLEPVVYEKEVAGRPYRVFELRYALFPQKSGACFIPGMVVQASLPSPARYRSFFDPAGGGEQTVTRRSAGQTITVHPQPPDYPVGAAWLPAADVALAEKWSRSLDDLRVGDAVTLTLDLRARGARDAQLPPIRLAEVDGVKCYQGEAGVTGRMTDQGMEAVRRETIVLMPTRPGTFQLPSLRVAWWDTRQSALRFAVIPGRELRVAAAPAEGDAAGSDVAGQGGGEPPSPVPTAPTAGGQTGPGDRVWMLTSGVLAVAWLATLLLLFRLRRRLTTVAPGSAERRGKEREAVCERTAFAAVDNACRRHDPHAARQALLVWARTRWPGEGITTLSDILPAGQRERLHCLLEEMDAILYSKDGTTGAWRGDELLAEVRGLRAERGATGERGSGLPPLYPAG